MAATKPRTDVNWLEVKARYVHNNMSTGELATEFGLTSAAVQKRCAREGWTEARLGERQRIAALVTRQASTTRIDELSKFNEDDLKMARALRARCAKLLNNSDATAPKAGGDAPKELTPSELRQIAATAEIAQRMGRLALGASTDNHGLAGPGGEGPVGIAVVTMEAYIEARKAVLEDF